MARVAGLKWLAAAGSVAVSVAACGASGDAGDDGEIAFGGSGASPSGGSAGAGGAAASGGGGGSAGRGGDAGSGGSIVVEAGVDAGDGGCNKVDFLFVVDASVSMAQEQAALTAAFPRFIESITAATAVGDFHIMVVDTDAESRCTAAGCARNPHRTCTTYACQNVATGCDATLGAGVVHPTGEGSSERDCGFAGGRRFLTAAQPELSATFSCAATLGLAGNGSERPMDAMLAALSPGLNQAGGCNAGFLRDDAVLVVTFISDDTNKEDTGTARQWYDAVVAAKRGNAEAVVMLGLIPQGASPSPTTQVHWHNFVSLWGERGLRGGVAASDYAPFFDRAIGVIAGTCREFEPPQ